MPERSSLPQKCPDSFAHHRYNYLTPGYGVPPSSFQFLSKQRHHDIVRADLNLFAC